ncbi:hypothetical protein NDU88_005628 [Pleurodeles waltl]|uniref:Uncharacterized protein n=1 Tax=Pleurodeles waltl TaxID=8319 RepID=A0AAV7UJT3_PLEWA|nr:hypothetical protein NDU88_005628 [Pleurodeles waltl]
MTGQLSTLRKTGARVISRNAVGSLLRGQGQVLLGVAKKELPLKCVAIERDIVELEEIALASGNPEDQEKLRQLELRSLVENHARNYTVAVNRWLYEVGDKASKLRRDREHA